MGKGSAPRKFSVDHQTFSSNWDQIFGKKSNGNRPEQSDQVHTGESTGVRSSEGGQGVYRELSHDGQIKVNE